MLRLNSSNPGKIAEFRKYLDAEIAVLSIDLPEPIADLETIIQYKASQFEGVLVDDTSLEIEGAEVGSLVRWKLHELAQWAGRPARFICLIGLHQEGEIYIYRGEVEGLIVEARGEGFGFNPYFQPRGANLTLAEEMQDRFNARFLALQKFKANQASKRLPVLKKWGGLFQTKD